jgi:hypothetical protein
MDPGKGKIYRNYTSCCPLIHSLKQIPNKSINNQIVFKRYAVRLTPQWIFVTILSYVIEKSETFIVDEFKKVLCNSSSFY